MDGRDPTIDFYVSTVQALLDRGVFAKTASTLVLAAGPNDLEAVKLLGLEHVTFSNVDVRAEPGMFAPYRFERHDAQRVDLANECYDQVIIANALHHCRSPHLALMEMHRVARHAVLAFENRDSLTMRLAKRFGFSLDYEFDAVYGNDMTYGGVDNTDVPNFVYRWKEEEVRKTVASFAPEVPPRLHFFYGLRAPAERLQRIRPRLLAAVANAGIAGLRLAIRVVPSQANLFAFCIEKNDEHWPWLIRQGDTYAFNKEWAAEYYKADSR